MLKDENYRPAYIEFDVAHDGSNMPESLGNFPTAEDAAKFMGTTFTAINQGITVSRHMDLKEKTEIRKEVNDLLENKLPMYEKDLAKANAEYNEAKKRVSTQQELVNATLSEAKGLALEVRRGLKDMQLDDLFTSRIPYKGRYYYYTYIDGQIKLCAIKDIPEHEKMDLWNIMAKNEEIIDANFAHEQVAAQTGEEE